MTLVPLTATTAPTTRARKPKVDGYDLVIRGQAVSWPRVTSILNVLGKPALLNWVARTNSDAAFKAAAGVYEDISLSSPVSVDQFVSMARTRFGTERADERVLREAGDIGTNVHKYIQWKVHQEAGRWDDVVEPELLTPAARIAVDAWLGWWEKQEKQPLFVEERVYNEEQEYAGTEDWKGWLNGKLVDLDWKTSGAIYDEAGLQNAAYAYAKPYSGEPYQRSEGGIIVRLPKKATDKPDYDSPEWCKRFDQAEQDRLFELFCKCRDLYRWMEGR